MLDHVSTAAAITHAAIFFLASGLVYAAPDAPSPLPSTTIGFPQQLNEWVIPGSPVEAQPIHNRDQAVVVRILETYPHGTDFRYDIEYQVLEPGTFNLANYLRRVDTADPTPIPPIEVEVRSLLGTGQILPAELAHRRIWYLSFYRLVLILGGLVWLLGLGLLVFYGRAWNTEAVHSSTKELTIAERLEPLLNNALQGELSVDQQAELERLLEGYWRNRLGLHDVPAPQLRERLRQHPEASQLLQFLDNWLHRPANAAISSAELEAILRPYQTPVSDADKD